MFLDGVVKNEFGTRPSLQRHDSLRSLGQLAAREGAFFDAFKVCVLSGVKL
jgi:hypothetical protein